ncbi:MAG TPA: hypothetical protein VEN29_12065 [Casimicrobiaceae bacterium]|nr:hypothetical protein [Casimicrobiaceae bacterium]
MNSLVGIVLVAAVAAMVLWVVFASAGALARRSQTMRQLVLAGNFVATVLGLVVGLWLPSRIPETSGSPASLVAVVLLWLVGGGLALLGATAFLGAFLASPGAAAGDDVDPGPPPAR